MARNESAAGAPTSKEEVAQRFRDALDASAYKGNLSALARDIAHDEGASTKAELTAKVATIRSQLQKFQRAEHAPEAQWAGRLSAKLGKPLDYFMVPPRLRAKSGRKATSATAQMLERLERQTLLVELLVEAAGLEVPPDDPAPS